MSAKLGKYIPPLIYFLISNNTSNLFFKPIRFFLLMCRISVTNGLTNNGSNLYPYRYTDTPRGLCCWEKKLSLSDGTVPERHPSTLYHRIHLWGRYDSIKFSIPLLVSQSSTVVTTHPTGIIPLGWKSSSPVWLVKQKGRRNFKLKFLSPLSINLRFYNINKVDIWSSKDSCRCRMLRRSVLGHWGIKTWQEDISLILSLVV